MDVMSHASKLEILIVDDNVRFIERMISLLSDVKNIESINIANDYNQASRILTEENPHVVLVDINLPGKNGIEILRQIRKTGKQCHVIMVTNHAEDYYREQCREMGADHFLDKSNDFAKVPGIIRQLGQFSVSG